MWPIRKQFNNNNKKILYKKNEIFSKRKNWRACPLKLRLENEAFHNPTGSSVIVFEETKLQGSTGTSIDLYHAMLKQKILHV